MDSFLKKDYINDERKNFTLITFSGYKKNQVLQQLEKSIVNSQIEESCHWSVELIISGMYYPLFDNLVNIYSKAININNPNFPLFLIDNFKKYLEISNQPNNLSEPMTLRNNIEIRHIFAKLVLCLSMSKKTHIYTLPKITEQELSISFIRGKFRSQVFFLKNIRKEKDHHELIQIGNELVMAIKSKHIQESIYWLSWILQWEKTNKKKKIDLCHSRKITNIDPKFENDTVWFIWTIIISLISNSCQKKQIMSLFHLFSYQYNNTRKNQRLNIIICAILFIIENCDYNLPISNDESQIKKGVNNIGFLYQEINENSNPNAHLVPPIIKSMDSSCSSIVKDKKPSKKKETDNLETENSFQKLQLVDSIFNSTFYS